MRVGVNTIPAGFGSGEAAAIPSHVDAYLRRVLGVWRKLEAAPDLTVYVHEANRRTYEGLEEIVVAPRAGLRLPWRSSASPLHSAVCKQPPDVLLSPLNAALADSPVPQVLLALDVADWQDAKDLKAVRRTCGEALAIVVASEYLRRRCLELFEVPLDRMIVAPPGVEKLFAEPRGPVADPPYLVAYSDPLTAGRIPLLRQTLTKRPGEFPDTFVVAGPGLPGRHEHWDDTVMHFEQCPDQMLAGLYQHSHMFLYPAVQDGSAMRVLEALGAGAIVLAPRAGAIPEYAGDLPFYYNPESMDSFVQAARRAFQLAPDDRKHRRHIAQNQTLQYTWEKTAWKLISAFSRG